MNGIISTVTISTLFVMAIFLSMKIYNYNGDYKYTILNSWIQNYKNGTFLSPHNHLSSNESNNKVFSVAYYIDDGDPDTSQSYSGCISFMSNKCIDNLDISITQIFIICLFFAC